jgi:hypothetical protein
MGAPLSRENDERFDKVAEEALGEAICDLPGLPFSTKFASLIFEVVQYAKAEREDEDSDESEAAVVAYRQGVYTPVGPAISSSISALAFLSSQAPLTHDTPGRF